MKTMRKPFSSAAVALALCVAMAPGAAFALPAGFAVDLVNPQNDGVDVQLKVPSEDVESFALKLDVSLEEGSADNLDVAFSPSELMADADRTGYFDCFKSSLGSGVRLTVYAAGVTGLTDGNDGVVDVGRVLVQSKDGSLVKAKVSVPEDPLEVVTSGYVRPDVKSLAVSRGDAVSASAGAADGDGSGTVDPGNGDQGGGTPVDDGGIVAGDDEVGSVIPESGNGLRSALVPTADATANNRSLGSELADTGDALPIVVAVACGAAVVAGAVALVYRRRNRKQM